MKILVILSVLAVTCPLIHAAYSEDFNRSAFQRLKRPTSTKRLQKEVGTTNDIIREVAVKSLSEKFKALLEHLKVIIKSGNDTFGIPVLDPFHLAFQEFNLKTAIFTGSADVKKFDLNGLSEYIVKDADFKIAKWTVKIDLLWPTITGKTSYNVVGYLLNKIRLFGSGDINYEINDFHFSTQVKLKVNFKTKKVSINYFDATEVSIKNLQMKITGLFEDDEISQLASSVLSDIIPDGIADFQEEITKEINDILKKNGNIFLSKYTLDDIKGIIN